MKAPNVESVALVGPDGSGKSTQAKLLRRLLVEEPKRARVYFVHPFGRKLLRVGSNSPVLSVPSGAKRARGEAKLLRRLITAADILDIALYLWLVYIRAALTALFKDREVWLVGDRSIDDVLIKHRRLGTLSKRAADLIRMLVPRFRTSIWLQVDPRVAATRDTDFDLSYYKELYEAYSAAAKRYGWRVVREAGQEPERVHASVVAELGLLASSTNTQESSPASAL